MQCKLVLGADEQGTTITLDIANTTPAFYMDGKDHSADAIADVLLLPVVTATWPSHAKRPIGFHV